VDTTTVVIPNSTGDELFAPPKCVGLCHRAELEAAVGRGRRGVQLLAQEGTRANSAPR
jgi:hypothetical protein